MTERDNSLGFVVGVVAVVAFAGSAISADEDYDQSKEIASFEKTLKDLQFDQVSCQVPSISGDEAVVPELPDSDAEWVVGSVTADVGDETVFTDRTSRIETGDQLSIVDADGHDQRLEGGVVCSAAKASKPVASDELEGTSDTRPYAISINGDAPDRPGIDRAADEGHDQNPVVETDVPAKPAVPHR